MPPPKLGDLMPNSLKEPLAEQNVKIGAVLRFYCQKAEKIKIHIYIGEDNTQENIAMLFVNTEINEIWFPTPELKAEHLKLTSANRNYLTHDCFVDCSEFITYSKKSIFDKCTQTPSIHLGSLSASDLTLIQYMVKKSKVLTTKQKKKYNCF